ncbi:hypothetical protein PG995_009807 [Apiospora arundinis]
MVAVVVVLVAGDAVASGRVHEVLGLAVEVEVFLVRRRYRVVALGHARRLLRDGGVCAGGGAGEEGLDDTAIFVVGGVVKNHGLAFCFTVSLCVSSSFKRRRLVRIKQGG